jgi:hypothetical protein
VGECVRFRSFRMINFEGFLCKRKITVGFCDYCVPSPSPWRICSLIITMTCDVMGGLCVLSCCHFDGKESGIFFFACSPLSNLMPICLLQALFPLPIYRQVNKGKPRFKILFIVLTQQWERLISPTKSWLICYLSMREFGRF